MELPTFPKAVAQWDDLLPRVGLWRASGGRHSRPEFGFGYNAAAIEVILRVSKVSSGAKRRRFALRFQSVYLSR